jgi:hypothetical protein
MYSTTMDGPNLKTQYSRVREKYRVEPIALAFSASDASGSKLAISGARLRFGFGLELGVGLVIGLWLGFRDKDRVKPIALSASDITGAWLGFCVAIELSKGRVGVNRVQGLGSGLGFSG